RRGCGHGRTDDTGGSPIGPYDECPSAVPTYGQPCNLAPTVGGCSFAGGWCSTHTLARCENAQWVIDYGPAYPGCDVVGMGGSGGTGGVTGDGGRGGVATGGGSSPLCEAQFGNRAWPETSEA